MLLMVFAPEPLAPEGTPGDGAEGIQILGRSVAEQSCDVGGGVG